MGWKRTWKEGVGFKLDDMIGPPDVPHYCVAYTSQYVPSEHMQLLSGSHSGDSLFCKVQDGRWNSATEAFNGRPFDLTIVHSELLSRYHNLAILLLHARNIYYV